MDKNADKGCILNSRILWTFSSAYRLYHNEKYLVIAQRAYKYMLKYFWDNEYSGLYMMVDHFGKAKSTRKQVYNLAFGIYGLSEYYMITEESEVLDRAIELYNLIEKHAYDEKNGGYFEALSREWQPIEDIRLSGKDANEKKYMNTHLHVLEAYTNLLRVWKSTSLKTKLKDLVEIMLQKVVESETYHFKLFFDEFYNSKSSIISYGHDIEGSCLLCEAAEVLRDETLTDNVNQIAVNMVQKAYEEGIDKLYGGLFNEAGDRAAR